MNELELVLGSIALIVSSIVVINGMKEGKKIKEARKDKEEVQEADWVDIQSPEYRANSLAVSAMIQKEIDAELKVLEHDISEADRVEDTEDKALGYNDLMNSFKDDTKGE